MVLKGFNFSNPATQTRFGLVFLAFSVLIAASTLIFKPLNTDGGFYLSVAREIAQQGLVNLDFSTGYTPLVLIFYSWIMSAFGQNLSFEVFQFVSIGVVVLNSVLVFQISRFWGIAQKTAFLGSACYLLLQLLFEGSDIVLEPWVMFFTLLGIHLLKYNHILTFFLAGMMCFFAFLSKQYGLASIGIVSFYSIVFFSRRKLIRLVSTWGGFLVSISLWYYFMPSDIIHSYFASTSSYGIHSITATTVSFAIFLVFRVPFILFSLIVGFRKEHLLKKEIIFLILAICCFVPAFYFKQYLHYYQFFLPFLILLWMQYLTKLKSTTKSISVVLLLAMSIAVGVRSYTNTFFTTKSEQKANSTSISNVIPPNSVVFIQNNNSQPYRYLCQLTPPFKNTYGFGFANVFSDSLAAEMFLASDYIISSNSLPPKNFKLLVTLSNGESVYQKN